MSVVARSSVSPWFGPLLAALIAVGPATAGAEPTAVMVRVLAHDAKFIGESMGGVAVTLSDARTGARLAEGTIAGGTGDTDKIMVRPQVRGAPIAGPQAGAFVANLDIAVPTLVRLEARGPLGKPDAAITVGSMRWVLPGQPVDGDGWIVEMPGLVIEPAWAPTGAGGRLVAKVTPMCGCPVTPGGLWDANRYRVTARLTGEDGRAHEQLLSYAGQVSTFATVFDGLPKGGYRLLLTAVNPDTGDVGVVEREVNAR